MHYRQLDYCSDIQAVRRLHYSQLDYCSDIQAVRRLHYGQLDYCSDSQAVRVPVVLCCTQQYHQICRIQHKQL